MTLSEDERFALRQGPVWGSVEEMLRGAEASLEELSSGAVATLDSRVGRFRHLREDDFQALFGIAVEARRVGTESSLVLSNLGERSETDGAQSVNAGVVELADRFGVLPACSAGDVLEPEGLDLDEWDLDLVLDAAELYSE